MNSAAAVFLANIPSPDRGVWQLGPFPLRAYALCIIAGIVVAIWWGERRWAQRGGRKGTIVDIAVFAVPFGLVGGRLYHVITDYQLYFGEGRNPINALKIWDGGLGIWGAIALGAVGGWIACRRKGIPLPAVADAVAPGIVVAQAIGRLGNYFNQELYGGETDLPWGLEIYRRVDPQTGLDDPLGGVAVSDVPIAVVHPTFLYELLWNLGVALLVVWADRRFRLGHGRAFALYVAGYTAGRFWIELMRTDPANEILGLRVNVWTSVLVFAGAVAYFVLAARRGPREDPAVLRGKEDPDTDGTDEPAAGTSDTADPADGSDQDDTGAKADETGTTKADETGTAEADETGAAKAEVSGTDETTTGDQRKVEPGQ
ncbi:prolipoprotein diacylglyceryl transferase [Amycolatopsis arida]|uniref:Phosphatidylglycerol--prolipoprotein diacylglyceryl transferase n=1 Tax=Amycolatopsis arida TaxID=587909 RepID=A0A1I5XU37_9PSEU|nr:prolipoprotein diacylglyceryl transferase [Amycolatopsis arida]TDX97263.1 prolipoprotein diacylglyceryl transferase [Amycolatopsis arida]SFQ35493.1 prolipoprotein diacylglyceryl transferase [Amycolatopsis arida]